MRLWALTGCRRDEIAGLSWTEVDFEHSCLRLADTKTGRSVRPLAGAALALLQSAKGARRPSSSRPRTAALTIKAPNASGLR